MPSAPSSAYPRAAGGRTPHLLWCLHSRWSLLQKGFCVQFLMPLGPGMGPMAGRGPAAPAQSLQGEGGTQGQTHPSISACCEPSEQALGIEWSFFPFKPQPGREPRGWKLLAVPFWTGKKMAAFPVSSEKWHLPPSHPAARRPGACPAFPQRLWGQQKRHRGCCPAAWIQGGPPARDQHWHPDILCPPSLRRARPARTQPQQRPRGDAPVSAPRRGDVWLSPEHSGMSRGMRPWHPAECFFGALWEST